MKKLLYFLFCFFVINISLSQAQQNLLQSGPMLGYSTFKEVFIWVQTKESAEVQIVYFPQNNPTERQTTEKVLTKKQTAFTAHLIAEAVPTQRYGYEVYINGEKLEFNYPLEFQSQTLWQWRQDPPAFTFAFGSCAYISEEAYDRPGEPYGSEYFIFEEIFKKKPDFMLWGGDNVYFREVDWDTQTGMFYRYTHSRSIPELQPLLASVHHYAIWDDHDYGPNDSDRGFWQKDMSLETFKLFWGNPNYEVAGGISGTFTWNDVQFFLLDNRSFRTPNEHSTDEPRTVLGQRQIQWLIDALTYSKASFKFVVMGGQFINPEQKFETYANLAPQEREQILELIKNSGVEGVIFLSGDRHHTEISVLEDGMNYPLYDITISPLTSKSHTPDSEGNTLQMPNTLITQRNFSIIEVAGKFKERILTIKVYDNRGEMLWERQIKAQDLR